MLLLTRILLFSLLLAATPSLLIAQNDTRTIKVTGSSTVNVSPNEIIVNIQYQEYFLGEEKEGNRITIDKIEEKVLRALTKANIASDKITLGGLNVVRPSLYKSGERIYLKRRLRKTLIICVETTDELLQVVRQMEEEKLMDEVITAFDITETRNTEIEKYQKQVKVDAFKDAWEKANLILSTSDQKPGAVLSVKEVPKQISMGLSPSTYDMAPVENSEISGFRAVPVSYQVEVVFEIVE
jgi:uncharacterized protein YggE